MDMRRIKQSNQYINVQQKRHQGSSSRSWFTSSIVTGFGLPVTDKQRHAIALDLFAIEVCRDLRASVEIDLADRLVLTLGQTLGRCKHIVVNSQRRSHLHLQHRA